MQTVRTNLTNTASTQYTNFDFNSMCIFNGALLGAGAAGLRKICTSDNDNGVDIDAYFIPATGNFEITKKKSCRYAYFDGTCDGDLQISMTGDGGTTIGPYSISPSVKGVNMQTRINMGRGLWWSYGSFRVDNVDGADFTIDNIDLVLS